MAKCTAAVTIVSLFWIVFKTFDKFGFWRFFARIRFTLSCLILTQTMKFLMGKLSLNVHCTLIEIVFLVGSQRYHPTIESTMSSEYCRFVVMHFETDIYLIKRSHKTKSTQWFHPVSGKRQYVNSGFPGGMFSYI